MQTNISMNTDPDIPEQGVELAKLIYDVAQDCDSSGGYRRTIDLSGLLDNILTTIETVKIRHDNPNLSEEEIQRRVDAITAENNRKQEALAAAKAAKREKVKQMFHGNAVEGYALAYSICQKDGSAEAKELSYRMLSSLRYLPVEERLEICYSYVDLLIACGETGNKIAEVYDRMACLVYPVSKKEDHTLCLSFYEKAYEYVDAPSRILDGVIGFCNLYKINDLREKCEQKKKTL